MLEQKTSKAPVVIKSIYFYLVSFVALMMVVFSTADIINIALKSFVFTKANEPYYYEPVACNQAERKVIEAEGSEVPPAMSEEECAALEEKNKEKQRESQAADNQRNIVRDISMIVVGIPLFIFHWGFIRKRKDEI